MIDQRRSKIISTLLSFSLLFNSTLGMIFPRGFRQDLYAYQARLERIRQAVLT